MIKLLSVAAILSATLATPVFAQSASQEPGVDAFYQSLGVVGSGPGAERGSAPQGSYASMDRDSESSCAQRYRSYDPASGTFLGHDGMRHHCQ
jgi:BA14K-like protein